jgi:hypothetical protein
MGSEKRVFENPLPVKSSEKRVFDKNFDGVRGNFRLNEKVKNQNRICNESLSFDDAWQGNSVIDNVFLFS